MYTGTPLRYFLSYILSHAKVVWQRSLLAIRLPIVVLLFLFVFVCDSCKLCTIKSSIYLHLPLDETNQRAKVTDIAQSITNVKW